MGSMFKRKKFPGLGQGAQSYANELELHQEGQLYTPMSRDFSLGLKAKPKKKAKEGKK